MNVKPLVSTLTSCYHAEKYLPLFLERLPEQTAFDRLEVVMDLNEPSAEELRLVRQFQEENPGHMRYTIQSKVVTYSASWNNCIRNSTGPYIAVWNVDDLRTPDSIERQARLLDHHPDVGVAFGKVKVVPRFGEKEGYSFDLTGQLALDATRLFILGPFYMFRRSLVDTAGYLDEQFQSSADYDHAIRLALHTKLAAVDGSLGYYLHAGEGLSNRPDTPRFVEDFVIRLRYGVYDKLWYQHLAAASRYNFYNLLSGTEWIPVERYVPNYQAMLEQRYRRWFDRGFLWHLVAKLRMEGWGGIRGVLEGLQRRV